MMTRFGTADPQQAGKQLGKLGGAGGIKVALVCALLCNLLLSGAVAAQAPEANNQASWSRQQWHTLLQWPTAECPLEAPAPGSTGVRLHPWAEGAELIEVACERWAYQGTALFYLRQAGSARLLDFAQFEAPDRGQLEPYRAAVVTGSSLLQARHGTLTVLRKYRGAGDCGQYLVYQIKQGQAELKQLRVRECSERLSRKPPAPATWPMHPLVPAAGAN